MAFFHARITSLDSENSLSIFSCRVAGNVENFDIPGSMEFACKLDPTCGSGTTAYVAEQWGRRWITIDTSRVALAIARQRLLTAKFHYYELKDDAKGVAGGLKCKTVPHITLKSIAQNTNLDPIFSKREPVLDKVLAACNDALAKVPTDLKTRLAMKLVAKQKAEGKRAVADADRRPGCFRPITAKRR